MSDVSGSSNSDRRFGKKRKVIDNKTLIKEVRSRRALWDTNCKDYGDRSLKIHLWEATAKKINRSVSETKSRWKHLKDSFNREVRNMKKSTKMTSKWFYFDLMSFLLDGTNSWLSTKIKTEISSDDGLLSYSMIEIEPESENTAFNCEGNELSENSYVGTEEDHESTPKRIKCESYKDTSNIRVGATTSIQMDSVSECRDSDSLHSQKDNEDYHFLMSLLPNLQSLSPKQKMLAKIKIMQDLYEATYGEGNLPNDNSSSNVSICF